MLRTLAEVPLVWFLLGLLAAWLLLGRAGGPRWLGTAAGAASVATLLGVAALNVRTAGFLVSFGANVLGIAAAHRNGQAMYHAVGGPELYTLVYGPYTYLVYEPLLRFGDALTAVKLQLALLDLVTLAATFFLLRRRGLVQWQSAVALTGVAAAWLLAVPAGVLGIRGDMWVVCALLAGLLALHSPRWWVAAGVTGACCGFCMDVKATLVMQAILLLVLLWRRHGTNAAVLAGTCAVAVAAAPFALDGISARNYLAWLSLSNRRVTFAGLVLTNLLFAAFLLAPAVLVWIQTRRRTADRLRWAEPTIFVAALVVAIATGAKSGGGPWHLWPLLPFVLWWTARRLALVDSRRLTAALALAALVVSARWGLRAVRTELPRTTLAARTAERDGRAELLDLAARHPTNALELAPGATMTSDPEDLRYVLVADGEPYGIDVVAAGEALKTDPALLEQLAPAAAACGTLWAVPHGEVPFSTRNNNETQADYPQVFPQSVRDAFLAGHPLVERGRAYDLWSAPPPHGLPGGKCE